MRGRHRAEVRVRVRVAVDVLELDEAAEPARDAHADDAAVLHGDHGCARIGVDRDAAATGGALDHLRGVRAPRDARLDLALRQVVRVGGLGTNREPALGEAGEGADEVGGQATDQASAHQHAVHVPVRMVVGEDRLTDVVLGTRRLQVAPRREDRVHRVVRILLAVPVGIHPVGLPRRRDELHPPQRTRRRHIQVATVIRLDLVDRRQNLPTHPVLDPRRLIDRQQERRNPELLDEEIRHPDRRHTRQRDRQAGVVGAGGAVGVATLAGQALLLGEPKRLGLRLGGCPLLGLGLCLRPLLGLAALGCLAALLVAVTILGGRRADDDRPRVGGCGRCGLGSRAGGGGCARRRRRARLLGAHHRGAVVSGLRGRVTGAGGPRRGSVLRHRGDRAAQRSAAQEPRRGQARSDAVPVAHADILSFTGDVRDTVRRRCASPAASRCGGWLQRASAGGVHGGHRRGRTGRVTEGLPSAIGSSLAAGNPDLDGCRPPPNVPSHPFHNESTSR